MAMAELRSIGSPRDEGGRDEDTVGATVTGVTTLEPKGLLVDVGAPLALADGTTAGAERG